MQLNRYQQDAVQDDSNACLVNANVGSGKTTVLIEKIRYLHEVKQVPFSAMCVLTFTNKAAGEIRERLKHQELISGEEEELMAGTFHAVAWKLLQEYLPVEELGYRKDFQIMIPEEELETALQLITQNGLKIKYKNRMKKRLDQEGCGSERRICYQDDWQLLMEHLKEEKIKQNKMTYRELLQNASILLEKYPQNLSFQWIIVDEVQDCDQLQMAFLEQLKRPQTHLFAVGDPNQVIYSWRGSVFQIFPLLRMKYHAKELSLPVNYRSTGTILEAARRFLQNGSELEGCRGEGQKIIIKKHYDSFQEADYLAGKIRELHRQGVPYGEIGIFYRLQSQSEILEKTLDRYKIPCQVSVKKSMQDIPVLHWLFYVMKAICYPEDETSLFQALCDKQYGEGWTQKKAVKELEKIRARAVHAPASTLPERITDLQKAGTGKENRTRKAGSETWMEELIGFLHLEEQILPTSASYQEDMALANHFLDELCQSISGKYDSSTKADKTQRNEEISLADWIAECRECLNQIALSGMHMPDNLEKEYDESDKVKLMTLHASKGLEFTYVFLIGVNYGLIPLLSGKMESEEEERRLFFVGMTRAKEYLELSYYTSPDGARVMAGPSRFLRFLPERLVDAPEDFREQSRSRESAQAHLQEIKKQMEQTRQRAKEEQKKQTQTVHSDENGRRKRVHHARYGRGIIIEENEMQITVEFEDYGKKEFIRQFATLEYLDE